VKGEVRESRKSGRVREGLLDWSRLFLWSLNCGFPFILLSLCAFLSDFLLFSFLSFLPSRFLSFVLFRSFLASGRFYLSCARA